MFVAAATGRGPRIAFLCRPFSMVRPRRRALQGIAFWQSLLITGRVSFALAEIVTDVCGRIRISAFGTSSKFVDNLERDAQGSP